MRLVKNLRYANVLDMYDYVEDGLRVDDVNTQCILSVSGIARIPE